jgi:hypothetical protein
MPTNLIQECYRRAVDARRIADATSKPSERVDFLEMERRWLFAAHTISPKSAVREPVRATEQSSKKAQVEPLQPPTPQDQAGTQATSVNFAISMRYKGQERTTELILTEDLLTRLAVEAQFRNMGIAELVGELIIATMRNDLFREVLDAEHDAKQAS